MDQNKGIRLISLYFPDLTPRQLEQFSMLEKLYSEWNKKVNVISRKDIDALYERHILHSLSIAKYLKFIPGTRLLDIGTGGGFPGIPLAVFFPDSFFFLTDSIAKKIKVVENIAAELDLKNVSPLWLRSETFKDKVDFVVSRAVAPFPDLVRWSSGKISRDNKNSVSNGIICLKGGDLTVELDDYGKRVEIVQLKDWFEEDFFLGKKLIYMPL